VIRLPSDLVPSCGISLGNYRGMKIPHRKGRKRVYMKRILHIAAGIALCAPISAIAQGDASTKIAPAVLVENMPPSGENMGSSTEKPRLHMAEWFVGDDGLVYSNICQTPYFWVRFRRYYLVGSGCVATNGYTTATGVMIQQ
jgi:hypothetical protein